MIQAAIVDDLPQDGERLKNLLAVYGKEKKLSIQADLYQSGEEFLRFAQKGVYSLVFLDIVMKGINGLETAKKFRQLDTQALLVFVTTESGYAVEGYEVDASGFLVKSVPPNVKAFHRMMDRLIPKLKHIRFLDLSNTELRLRMPVDTLQYVDVSDHSLALHTLDATYHLRMPLEKLKSLLPQDARFFQCHRGVLVNLDWISSVEKEVVHMKNGEILPVSRRNYRALLDAQAAWNFARLRENFQ